MRRLTDDERAEREAAKARRYAEKQAAREAARERRRADWPTSPHHSHVQHEQAKAAIVSELAEPVVADIRSVDALRDIMNDSSANIGRRVEAAECVLGFELPPAALARELVEPVNSGAYAFLKRVSITPGIADAVQFRALKALTAIESAKPKKTDPLEAENRRRRNIQLINAARRSEMLGRGAWKPEDSGNWFIRPDDTFDDPTLPGERRCERSRLLAVTIRNRHDPFALWLENLPHGSKT